MRRHKSGPLCWARPVSMLPQRKADAVHSYSPTAVRGSASAARITAALRSPGAG